VNRSCSLAISANIPGLRSSFSPFTFQLPVTFAEHILQVVRPEIAVWETAADTL